MSIALAAVAGCEVLKEESGVSGAPDTGRKKVPSQKRESFSCKLFVKCVAENHILWKGKTLGDRKSVV